MYDSLREGYIFCDLGRGGVGGRDVGRLLMYQIKNILCRTPGTHRVLSR